jgi:beta-phosphoglucomutase
MKAVIFDMDGVIVDSHGIINRLFTEVINRELHLNITEKEFARWPGIRFDQRLVIIAKEKGLPVSEEQIVKAIDKGRLEYYTNIIAYVKLFPGTLTLFDQLKSAGIKLGLGSNGSRNSIEKLMENLKIKKYFSSVVTFDDVVNPKPDAEMFLKNALELNVNPEECVVVEDAPEGIAAAKAAGMKVIALATTTSREELENADLLLSSISEITLDMLKGLK